MSDERPILVTGAAGSVGRVGRSVVGLLRRDGLPVRALVRREDERAEALRAIGAEVVAGDLARAPDVARALDGCRSMYFGMSVSSSYLEAALTTTAVARRYGGLDAFVAISQMTVSQMDVTSTEESAHQRWHWLAEQALAWSGVPAVYVRPTVFLENPLFTTFAAASIRQDGTIRLPFGAGRTSPVAAGDVAESVAAILRDPRRHVGKVYELTGPRSRDLTAMAEEFSRALGRTVTYVDEPAERWLDRDLRGAHLPPHLAGHLAAMARLHAANRYDRATRDVELLTGRPASTLEDFVRAHPELYRGASPA
ncbi:NmrA family NAD(P)-binding protein [Sphaerisporangium sp. TRM90804]|uniref:NmrA family NAD(P)-binding protein n=1 Tax=Sphaerisporangium sp. TRM90804 TaxID=3031113 RepID=UPI00244BAB8C|nr:NmrA family NAD(P)-binding protein [Sphaerisporangium sp. TRM90804]MDH2424886.1 NmrA family NAD(P)-binding protein [Sphaerisporangium sp. TRM90804]